MFLLVNTFTASPQTRGSVISRHRSQSAAFDAMSRHQSTTKRRYGARTWLPMIVISVERAEMRSVSDVVPVGIGRLVAEREV